MAFELSGCHDLTIQFFRHAIRLRKSSERRLDSTGQNELSFCQRQIGDLIKLKGYPNAGIRIDEFGDSDDEDASQR